MKSRDGLQRLLREMAIETDSEPALKLQNYLALLEKWNKHINLTANIAWGSLEPLFREGIQAAAYYPGHDMNHLDIGSGAGFPALILRIFHPLMRLEMVESRGKKGAFLENAAWELDLPHIQVHVKRLEELLATCPPDKHWDCVSWKAIRLSSRDLYNLCTHTDDNSRYWMFHGKGVAVEDADILEKYGQCIEKRPFLGQSDSYLSIYKMKPIVV